MVEVHLYGRFIQLLEKSSAVDEAVTFLPVEEGDTIADVLRRLGIPLDEVSHLFLNAEYSGARRRVKPGDRLGIFPKEMGLLYRQYFPKIEE